jgi:hypothetical protein
MVDISTPHADITGQDASSNIDSLLQSVVSIAPAFALWFVPKFTGYIIALCIVLVLLRFSYIWYIRIRSQTTVTIRPNIITSIILPYVVTSFLAGLLLFFVSSRQELIRVEPPPKDKEVYKEVYDAYYVSVIVYKDMNSNNVFDGSDAYANNITVSFYNRFHQQQTSVTNKDGKANAELQTSVSGPIDVEVCGLSQSHEITDKAKYNDSNKPYNIRIGIKPHVVK